MHVRLADRNDIEAMVELERESPTSANWSHEHFESLFRTAAPELSNCFVLVAEYPSGQRRLTASVPASSIVAYLAAHRVDSDWELQYIVVGREFRRRGVATRLLKEFISHARASGTRIFLEVRETNESARRLYEAFGFEQTGIRKKYYPNPPEDAVLYRLKL